MNKYAAQGLLVAALEGRNIIVLTRARAHVREVIGEFQQVAPHRVEISERNGGVFLPGGGSIRVQSFRSSLRGCSADTVYLDHDVDFELNDPSVLKDIQDVVITSPTGEIIRA